MYLCQILSSLKHSDKFSEDTSKVSFFSFTFTLMRKQPFFRFFKIKSKSNCRRKRASSLFLSLSPLLNPPLSPDLIEREGIKLIIVIFKGILNIFVMPYILFLYFAWRARVIDSDTSMNIYAWWATFPLFIIFWKSCLKYLI